MKYRIIKKENHVTGQTYYYIDNKKYWINNWSSAGWCTTSEDEAKKKIDELIIANKGTETITIIKYP